MWTEYFKAGQIVPRRLKLALAQHKGAQHLIKFGADCMVQGRTIKIIGDGPAIVGPANLSAPRKNGTRMRCGLYINGVCVIAP